VNPDQVRDNPTGAQPAHRVGPPAARPDVLQTPCISSRPLVNAFIQISISGGVERRSKYGAQTNDAVRDENSVVFLKKQQPAFEHLRDSIEAAISGLHRPAPPAAPANISSQLAQLAELRTTGALSETEFQTAKLSLLHD
jgi:hypothetical protein